MMDRLIEKALKKGRVKSFLPNFASGKKILEEAAEHFGFVQWGTKRIVLPLAVFYLIVGFFLQEHVLGSLLLAFLVFLYANFLPDLDAFFSGRGGKNIRKTGKFEKRIALFFAPLVIYYLLSRKLKQWDLGSEKPFHSKRALFEFSFFLFLFGLLLYFSLLKAFFLMLFGFLGFLTHLAVDEVIIFPKIKKAKADKKS